MRRRLLNSPSILASSTLVLWNALEAHGHKPAAIFEQAGLDSAQLRDPDARYSSLLITALHRETIEATKDPCFMLKLSDFWHPSHLHALGYGWMASTSLRHAFERLVRYYDIASYSGERVELVRVDGNYIFSLDFSDFPHGLHESEGDSVMVVLMAMCRISAGKAFRPLKVEMTRSRPSCAREFRQYFGASVEFSADRLSMLLPGKIIDAELPTANTTLARACDQIIDDYLSRLDRTHVVNKVRSHLIELMPSGRVSEHDVAAALHMSARSLQRRLKEEDTTFKSLLDETRRELALSYVRDRHTSINEITYLLGYSDPANFSRAFKRWTGKSPSGAREALQ